MGEWDAAVDRAIIAYLSEVAGVPDAEERASWIEEHHLEAERPYMEAALRAALEGLPRVTAQDLGFEERTGTFAIVPIGGNDE